MKLIKNNYIVILILLLAIILRVNTDTILPGYNFDEIAMISIAKQSSLFEILKCEALLDYHAPLYYLTAHFFTSLPHEWFYLRVFNIFLSIVNVFIFYKIGKILKNRKLGYILALYLAISHIHISIANFVKFYVLCFLIFSCVIYYLTKVIKYKKNYIKLGIFNGLFCLSATLGILYVLVEYIFLFIFDKSNWRKVLKSFIIALFGFIIYLPILIYQSKIAFNNIISPHSAYQKVDLYVIYEIFNDYISPLVDYSFNTETVDLASFMSDIIYSFQNGRLDVFSILISLILSLIPVVISLYLVFKKKDTTLKILLTISTVYLISFVTLSVFDKVGLIPLYVYPFGLVFIIAIIFIADNISNKKIKYTILSYLIIIQLIIPNCYPLSKRVAEQGKYKIFYCIENYFKNNKDDRWYIMTTGGRFLEKYYKNKKIISFDYEQTGLSHNNHLAEIIYGKEEIKKLNQKNINSELKNLINKPCRQEFENYFNSEILSKIKKGEKLTYAFNSDVSTYVLKDEEETKLLNKRYINKIGGFESLYTDYDILTPVLVSDISTSYCNKCLIKSLDRNFKKIKVEQYLINKNGEYELAYSEDNSKYSTEWIAENALTGWIFITFIKE